MHLTCEGTDYYSYHFLHICQTEILLKKMNQKLEIQIMASHLLFLILKLFPFLPTPFLRTLFLSPSRERIATASTPTTATKDPIPEQPRHAPPPINISTCAFNKTHN